MKILLLLLLLAVGCVKENHDMEGADAPESLESAVATFNSNLQALDIIAQASLDGQGIKTCLPQKSGYGYAILFTDGKSVSIRTAPVSIGNGSNPPEDTPMVGIRKTEDGFEWTSDGEATGFSAGKSEKTPEFKAENGSIVLYLGGKAAKTYNLKDRTVNSYLKDIASGNGTHTLRFIDGTSLEFSSKASEALPPIQGTGTLRRPISAQQPMWIIHIDTWLHPDPQKVIDLIPADILPYVVFNLSFSVEGDRSTGKWTKVEYAYETAKSWIRVCAMNRVWAMIQPASGAYCHFKDTETYSEISESLYAEFFRDYPNFLGFNYCEQFWGFGEEHSVTYEQRLVHWANLMRLTHEYGGYLTISCCGPYYAASMNPVAMIKTGGEFADMCRACPENLIICEKFTSKYGFLNNESACMGMWLAGLAGNYGIRYDTCGWTETAETTKCPLGAGIIAQFEHLALTGGTVIDGPELIWQECYREVNAVKTSDGYTSRKWEIFPQFENINIDLFRKILDGTIRIPSRNEVIDRSGMILLHDINSGNDQQKYTAPAGLYEGLYQMDDDGDLLENRTWFKKTGRYPAIPYAAELNDAVAQRFKHKIQLSGYSGKWSDKDRKVEDFNEIFPEEYTGDIFAGRMDNLWVTYNPYKEIRRAEGIIPLKINSCEKIRLSHPNFSAAVIVESADRLDVYLNNYDTAETGLKEDIITIYGATSTPVVTYTDRATHSSSILKTEWEGDVFTISLSHNGPTDLEIMCSGDHTGKNSSASVATVTPPERPDEYNGIYQFEAENFDYKNIASVVKNGSSGDIRNYTGQGYMKFGQKSGAAAKVSFRQNTTGQYAASIRYSAPGSNITGLALYANGNLVQVMQLSKTLQGEWNTYNGFIDLKAGLNTLEIKAQGQLASELTLDSMELIPVNR